MATTCLACVHVVSFTKQTMMTRMSQRNNNWKCFRSTLSNEYSGETRVQGVSFSGFLFGSIQMITFQTEALSPGEFSIGTNEGNWLFNLKIYETLREFIGLLRLLSARVIYWNLYPVSIRNPGRGLQFLWFRAKGFWLWSGYALAELWFLSLFKTKN